MDISFVGLIVAATTFALGSWLGSGLIVGLIASVAFGSTSGMSLSAVGGSSPLIYVLFALALVSCAAFDTKTIQGLSKALRRDWVGFIVFALMLYASVSAFILPRLFTGATNAFVAGRDKGVIEVALAPVSGNITQTSYFVIGCLTFLVLSSKLARHESVSIIRTGFLVFIAINALGGVIDFVAKNAGAGDVLLPIRTATYAYLTNVEQGGFARINGTYSEASTFGGTSVNCLAFLFTQWRYTGSTRILLCSMIVLFLIVMSTSSTAYAGVTLLLIPLAISLIVSLSRGRLEAYSLIVVCCAGASVAVMLAITVYDPTILEPFQHLLQTTVFDKADSESGRERSHWNERSLMSLFDTDGLGIGYGSSRSSNWFIAVVSQLGIFGAGMQLLLVVPFLRRPVRPDSASPEFDAYVLHRSLSAFALTSLATSIIAGSGADPGILFFVALAGLLGCEDVLTKNA